MGGSWKNTPAKIDDIQGDFYLESDSHLPPHLWKLKVELKFLI